MLWQSLLILIDFDLHYQYDFQITRQRNCSGLSNCSDEDCEGGGEAKEETKTIAGFLRQMYTNYRTMYEGLCMNFELYQLHQDHFALLWVCRYRTILLIYDIDCHSSEPRALTSKRSFPFIFKLSIMKIRNFHFRSSCKLSWKFISK